MMKVKSLLAASLAVVMAASTLAGCTSAGGSGSSSSTSAGSGSGSSQAGEVISLEYWFEGAGPERTPLYQARVDEFNAANSDVQVNGVYVPLDSAKEKVNVAIAADSTPDLATLQDAYTSEAIAQGVLLALDDYFAAWDESANFGAEYIDAVRLKAADGKLYGIPQGSNLTGMWFRRDVFEEANLDAPTSWDNFFTAVTALTDSEANIYGHTIRGGTGSATQIIYAIAAYSGENNFWSEDGKTAVVLRNDAAEEFVTRYAAIFQNGEAPESSLTAGFKEMVADFTSGTAMTLIHNLGSYENHSAAFEPNQYAFIPFPPSPSTGKYTTVVPTVKSIVIFERTVTDADAAWRFIQHFTGKESQATNNAAIGELPTRADAMSEPVIQELPHLEYVIPFMADSDKTVFALPSNLPDYSSIASDIIEPAWQSVLVGNMSARDFLDTWADALEEAKAEYDANA